MLVIAAQLPYELKLCFSIILTFSGNTLDSGLGGKFHEAEANVTDVLNSTLHKSPISKSLHILYSILISLYIFYIPAFKLAHILLSMYSVSNV